MSYRPQYSYWLVARHKDPGDPSKGLDGLLAALKRTGMSMPDGPMSFRIEDGEIRGEVDPREGSTERTAEIAEGVQVIAQAFPDYVFELQELNEEDHSEKAYSTFRDGKLESRKFARTLDPDEIDRATLDAVKDKLRARVAAIRDAAASLGGDPAAAVLEAIAKDYDHTVGSLDRMSL